jgi:hypothetical protein
MWMKWERMSLFWDELVMLPSKKDDLFITMSS